MNTAITLLFFIVLGKAVYYWAKHKNINFVLINLKGVLDRKFIFMNIAISLLFFIGLGKTVYYWVQHKNINFLLIL